MIRALAIIIVGAVFAYAGAVATLLACQANACAALGADVCAERAGG